MASDGVVGLRNMSDTPHDFPFIQENRTLTWERLESQRLEKLGLNNRYSRHFNVLRQSKTTQNRERGPGIPCVVTPRDNQSKNSKGKDVFNKSNSIAPFATVGKATCGFFFSDRTDNRKNNFGIPPSDLVKWRNFLPSSAN